MVFLAIQEKSVLHASLNGPLEWGIVKWQPACGIHVFRTPLSPSEIFFFGEPAWNWMVESRRLRLRSHKLRDSHQSLHGTISFVTDRTCGIMFLHLNVFHFLSDSYTVYTRV